MNNAETAAAWRMCAHRQNSNSGVRNIPPPVPVRPERKPSPAPVLIATGRDGGSFAVGRFGERPGAWRKKAAQRLSKFGEPKQTVAGNRRRMRPERKTARMPRIISTRNDRPPKLKRSNERDQNVKHKRRRSNNRRCKTKQRHRSDVTRRTRRADG